jgi:hypothetical protein
MNAVRAGKVAPAPGSSAALRNAAWDEAGIWLALDSARGAAGGGPLPAATIAGGLVAAYGGSTPDLDRLVAAAAALDSVTAQSHADPNVVAAAADALRYAVLDAQVAPELEPRLDPAKQRLFARTAEVGDQLLLTAADALRQAQTNPAADGDPLNREIRDLLSALSSRPLRSWEDVSGSWNTSDFLRSFSDNQPGQAQPALVSNELRKLSQLRMLGDDDAIRAQAARLMPMVLRAKQAVQARPRITGEDKDTLLAELDSAMLTLEVLMDPQIGPPRFKPSAASLRVAREAQGAGKPAVSSMPGLLAPTAGAGLGAASSAPKVKPSAAALGAARKAAVMAGKEPPLPGSTAALRNQVWDDLGIWLNLDMARSAAGGSLPASAVVGELVTAYGTSTPDLGRLATAAASFDIVSSRRPPDVAALVQAADDLRYAVLDVESAPELRGPLDAAKQRLIAKTAQLGDQLLLTAADALRRVQEKPADAADPLTPEIRDLLFHLSSRPGLGSGSHRQSWDSVDVLRTLTVRPQGADQPVSVAAELGELDRLVQAGARDAARMQAARVVPMLLSAKGAVAAQGGMSGETRAKLLAAIDSTAFGVAGMLDPQVGPQKFKPSAASLRAAREAQGAGPTAASGPPSAPRS